LTFWPGGSYGSEQGALMALTRVGANAFSAETQSATQTLRPSHPGHPQVFCTACG